ncbi:MAG: GHMP kinase [Dehalococcoidia bacterium]|nr:GHMP kinase [Dehalococcoidia bacterium]|tara:strand:- start:4619 stop:5644 length:1026 start_codon:yes stop_codon:yes gene_type:complete
MVDHKKNFVITSTPLRISFAGGGTDFYDYYSNHEGAIVSSTIDKEIKVTVKRHSKIFNEKYRLNYSLSEITNNLEDVKNDIARECIKLVGIDYPLYISTIADLPEKSGLGSSSSFCVGLLKALYQLEGQDINNWELFKAAIEVELNVLKKPIGIQDQLAAVYGGLNFFKIHKDGSVDVEKFEENLDQSSIKNETSLEEIFNRLVLFWTSIQRSSSDILLEQEQNITNNIDNLNYIKNLAYDLWGLISRDFESKEFGRLLEMGWQRKIKLASKISNSEISDLYDSCKSLGSDGGKLSGAGGGGFLLMVVDQSKRNDLINGIDKYDNIDINFNPNGSRVLLSE